MASLLCNELNACIGAIIEHLRPERHRQQERCVTYHVSALAQARTGSTTAYRDDVGQLPLGLVSIVFVEARFVAATEIKL